MFKNVFVFSHQQSLGKPPKPISNRLLIGKQLKILQSVVYRWRWPLECRCFIMLCKCYGVLVNFFGAWVAWLVRFWPEVGDSISASSTLKNGTRRCRSKIVKISLNNTLKMVRTLLGLHVLRRGRRCLCRPSNAHRLGSHRTSSNICLLMEVAYI